MKNEELKKKICEIIAPYVSVWGEDERIADALIAAGIGDVSELKKHRVQIMKDGTIQQFYSGKEVEQIVKEREEYKHRVEVAERALLSLWWNNPELYDYCIKQAEKELAEEEKDDR